MNLLASSYEILLRKNNLLVRVIKCLVFIIFLTAQKKKKKISSIYCFIYFVVSANLHKMSIEKKINVF